MKNALVILGYIFLVESGLSAEAWLFTHHFWR